MFLLARSIGEKGEFFIKPACVIVTFVDDIHWRGTESVKQKPVYWTVFKIARTYLLRGDKFIDWRNEKS